MNEEQTKLMKKQLRHMRIQTTILVMMLVIVLAVGACLSIAVMGAVRQVQSLDLNRINDAIVSIENVAAGLENVDMTNINNAVDALSEAAGTLSKTDIEALNEGVRSLSTAANHLKDMDIEKLNSLIDSLQTVAAQMEKTSSIFSKIFG